MCGLKHLCRSYVTIEIPSHPTWVCGLKQAETQLRVIVLGVTPYVGVWIETYDKPVFERGNIVTPYVGVWIET